ncbi:venom allergen 5-like [Harmonia axyridis]|uniref:venom allergen 5-like n=1 Tax=Harmonia axyridis TaxID=115357 RepID=UPI001E2771F5|nr:venom allergen 5-like [Harmonia axyridis]
MRDYLVFFVLSLLVFQSRDIKAFTKCVFKIIDSAEKVPENDILSIHNKYRAMIMNGSTLGQPRAAKSSMNFLTWDPKLAELAQQVSRTCEFRHVDVNTTEYPEGLGQNLYRSCSNKRRKPNWAKVIGDWYDENKIYKFPKDPTVLTGHYTQVVWGKTKVIGCAQTEYFRGNTSKVPFCTIYVCHYAPRGNIIGEPPYKSD